jgi:transcriptional regulator with XRE-family HTH domain
MNPIETLERDIGRAIPTASTRLRRPRNPNGQWWLDVDRDEYIVTVQWSPRRGFGVSASMLGDGYGEGPEETFDSLESATRRVRALLEEKTHTVPPQAVFLREFREMLGVTQIQLAERIGVQQAAISRLERREDITLSSLRRFVSALGGDLEISVRTPDGERLQLTGGPEAKPTLADRGRQEYRPAEPPGRVNLLVIRTQNLERARTFYSQLGLEFHREKHARGPLHYSCALDGMVLELYPTDTPPSPVRLGLRVPAISRAMEDLVSSGCLHETPSYISRDSGTRVCIIRDPDGNTLELSPL